MSSVDGNNNLVMEEVDSETENVVDSGGMLQFEGIDFNDLRREDLELKEFNSIEEVEDLYNRYAKAVGFSVRKDKKEMNVSGKVSRRIWVCSKEGTRVLNKNVNVKKPLTREKCPAVLQVNLVKKRDTYIVKKFEPNHNHALATVHEATFLRSHRNVRESDLAQAIGMRRVAIRTCHVYEYMVDQAGGYMNVGFQSKDLYNKLNAARRQILLEGDAEASLAYLKSKACSDSEFFCKFSVDEENRLVNLFWRDSNSLTDYMCFGDVIEFDSTYKTNHYEKPLILFVGLNHHRASTIFGCAYVRDESAETFKWVLETFILSMKGKKPKTVLTDGDEAMRKAVEIVLPGSKHKLCAWHVASNVHENLKNVTDPNIKSEFNSCLWEPLEVDEFEARWKVMEENFKLNEHQFKLKSTWLAKMWERRHSWAEAYNRGVFLAGMSTTQRSESMNKFVKDYIKSGPKMFECVHAIDRALARLRNNAARDEFKSNNCTPVMTTQLKWLEQHAASMYTLTCFELVRDEMLSASALINPNTLKFAQSDMHYISKYCEPDNMWTVVWHTGSNEVRIECCCKKYETDGIPCSHIFCVLKYRHMDKIPESLIMKRWTKGAKSDITFSLRVNSESSLAVQTARYGYLNALCNKLCYSASRSDDGFKFLSNEFHRLEGVVEELGRKLEETNLNLGSGHEEHGDVIKDPEIARTKGSKLARTKDRRGTKPKACGTCKAVRHRGYKCSIRKQQGNRKATQNVGNGNDGSNNDIGQEAERNVLYGSEMMSESNWSKSYNYNGARSYPTGIPTESASGSMHDNPYPYFDGISYGNDNPIQTPSGSFCNSECGTSANMSGLYPAFSGSEYTRPTGSSCSWL